MNKGAMRYRVIELDERIVLTEDGGVACIRTADEMDTGDGRESTTDYYQDRITQELVDSLEEGGSIWDILSEGKMYYNDWTTPELDPEHIKDALAWLCIDCEFKRDDTIWSAITDQMF